MSKTDWEWEELEKALNQLDKEPSPKNINVFIEADSILDFRDRFEESFKKPNPNKVYYNSNTCSVYDEYNTLLGYGEILNEVFN